MNRKIYYPLMLGISMFFSSDDVQALGPCISAVTCHYNAIDPITGQSLGKQDLGIIYSPAASVVANCTRAGHIDCTVIRDDKYHKFYTTDKGYWDSQCKMKFPVYGSWAYAQPSCHTGKASSEYTSKPKS